MTRWVLITRTPSDCADLQRMLAGSDLRLRPFPVLRVEDVNDDRHWEAATTAARHPDAWLVFTSPRAPERLRQQAERRSASELLRLPTAAIGDATARAARAADFEPEVVGPGSGADLAAALTPRLAPQAPVVLACGRDRRPELPDGLAAAGHPVVPLIVYAMRPTPPRELPPLPATLHAVVLTSPRSASLYLEGVGGRPLPCTHWALGPTTRDAAEALGVECKVPTTPRMESLAEGVCRT